MTDKTIFISKQLSIDIETYDPYLLTMGPGVRRKDGRILGVAIGNLFDEVYLPYTEELKSFLTDLFLEPDRLWITANGLYDFDWLQYDCGIPKGKFFDVQWAEALLDEQRESYSLDSLSLDYFKIGKDEEELIQWCKAHGLKGKPQTHLHLMPFRLVEKYAKKDARLTFDLYEAQVKKIEENELQVVCDLEHELTPLYLEMRRHGVRIDTVALARVGEAAELSQKKAQESLDSRAGFSVNVNASASLQRLFDENNIPYPYTKTKKTTKNVATFVPKPSFAADFLMSLDNPIANNILEIKSLGKIKGTFVDGWQKFLVENRLHGLFHPLRGDEGGTVTRRLSCSTPNLQQIPSRVQKTKKLLRSLFIPEEGCWWSKTDYSQVEYRIFAHYAVGPGAEQLRNLFCSNLSFDIHAYMAQSLNQIGIACTRSQAKTINFGIMFGMGVTKLGLSLGMSDARGFLGGYHKANPFLKATLKHASTWGTKRGYVKSILGGKSHISADRAYVALNRVIQPTAADILKKAMLDTWKAGVYNVLTPHITVHDEMDCSVPKTKEGLQALREQVHIFENTIKLSVPLFAETELGTNWADVSSDFFKEKACITN